MDDHLDDDDEDSNSATPQSSRPPSTKPGEENNDGEEEVDKKMGDNQLLPNLCAELDLESELWSSSNNRPNSAASTASDDVTISASPL